MVCPQLAGGNRTGDSIKDESLADAAGKMRELDVGALPICGEVLKDLPSTAPNQIAMRAMALIWAVILIGGITYSRSSA